MRRVLFEREADGVGDMCGTFPGINRIDLCWDYCSVSIIGVLSTACYVTIRLDRERSKYISTVYTYDREHVMQKYSSTLNDVSEDFHSYTLTVTPMSLQIYKFSVIVHNSLPIHCTPFPIDIDSTWEKRSLRRRLWWWSRQRLPHVHDSSSSCW